MKHPFSGCASLIPRAPALLLLLLTLAACSTTPQRPDIGSPNLRAAYNRPYTIRGQTYYPMASSIGYRERGLASWYGHESGNTTSMGMRFDPDGLSAAHKTLPLPTWARVTNLDNGRSIELLVNDRGPFVPGRIMDLSAGSARALGITGLGRVEIEALSVAPSTPSLAQGPSAAPDANTAGSAVYLQAGAFSRAENAERRRQQLQAAGFYNVRLENKSPYFLVLVGPFASQEARQAASLRLSEAGIHDLREARH